MIELWSMFRWPFVNKDCLSSVSVDALSDGLVNDSQSSVNGLKV